MSGGEYLVPSRRRQKTSEAEGRWCGGAQGGGEGEGGSSAGGTFSGPNPWRRRGELSNLPRGRGKREREGGHRARGSSVVAGTPGCGRLSHAHSSVSLVPWHINRDLSLLLCPSTSDRPAAVLVTLLAWHAGALG